MKVLGHQEGVKLPVVELRTAGVHNYISGMVIIVVQLVHSIGGGQGTCGMHQGEYTWLLINAHQPFFLAATP